MNLLRSAACSPLLQLYTNSTGLAVYLICLHKQPQLASNMFIVKYKMLLLAKSLLGVVNNEYVAQLHLENNLKDLKSFSNIG